MTGAALLIAGAAGYFGATEVGQRDPQAVSFAIDLRSGSSRSPVFRAAHDASYEVGLEVDRVLPFKTTNCLLGVRRFDGPDDLPPAECAATPSPLDLEWTVYEGGRVLASGLTEPGQYGAYGTTITRALGRAELQPGRDYLLEVRSNRDASVLAPARPRITVAVHPSAWKDEWVWRSLGAMGGAAIGLFGVGYLAAAGVARLRRR